MANSGGSHIALSGHGNDLGVAAAFDQDHKG